MSPNFSDPISRTLPSRSANSGFTSCHFARKTAMPGLTTANLLTHVETIGPRDSSGWTGVSISCLQYWLCWSLLTLDSPLFIVNYCPEHEKCETFEQKFKTAKNFCSKIWDESFTVVDDPQNCISFEFQETSNPNQKAAKFYEDLFSSSISPQSGASWIFALLLTSLYFAL